MGFHMVRIYTDNQNFTDPYDYVSEVLNIHHVRISKYSNLTRITSWCGGTYAPRHQLVVL